METERFHKISIPGNQVKFRYFMESLRMKQAFLGEI